MEEFSGEEGSFNSEEASNSVKECIQSIIGEESYRQDTVNQWTAKIVEQALTLLVKQTKSYKYIVSCAVMQKSGAGLHTANSCYWDTVTDGSCTVKWENRTMYCVVSVFAVALTPRPGPAYRRCNASPILQGRYSVISSSLYILC